jgi:hypothetical protein
MEKSAANIEVDCKRGCSGSFAYSKLAEHDKDCVGKVPVLCLGVNCLRAKCKHESVLWSTAIEHHVQCYGANHGDIVTCNSVSYYLRRVASAGLYKMNKTSNCIHWAVGVHTNGEGHRAFYVKIVGRLPDAPINVELKIYDTKGKKTFLAANVDACCAVNTAEDILKSGDFLSIHDS